MRGRGGGPPQSQRDFGPRVRLAVERTNHAYGVFPPTSSHCQSRSWTNWDSNPDLMAASHAGLNGLLTCENAGQARAESA
jgi:hypothetical protein